MNVATRWEITDLQGNDKFLDIKKSSHMRDSYIGTFTDLSNKALDVFRGKRAEWLEYLRTCKRAIREKRRAA